MVPAGYQEFCFKVDNEYVVSQRHPMTPDETCNWRTIYGPSATWPAKEAGHWFVALAESVAGDVGRLFLPRTISQTKHSGINQSTPSSSFEISRKHATNARYLAQGTMSANGPRSGRTPRASRFLAISLVIVGLYAIFSLVYVAQQFRGTQAAR